MPKPLQLYTGGGDNQCKNSEQSAFQIFYGIGVWIRRRFTSNLSATYSQNVPLGWVMFLPLQSFNLVLPTFPQAYILITHTN